MKPMGPAAKTRCFVFLAGLLLCLLPALVHSSHVLPDPAPQTGRPLPFKVGEQIEYSVSWEMVKAGRARFTVLGVTEYKGKKAWHFELVGKSRRWIDWLHKIRDKLESFTDEAFTRSLLYKKTQTGKADKRVVVEFDWQEKTATYSNHGGKRPSIEIPDHTFDPLSSFYKLRTLDLESGTDLFFPVSDGKKCFIQKGDVLKKERITVRAGTFDTVLIAPQVRHFSGVFEKSDKPTVRVWVSADEKQVPVRIKIKVVIGSIIFDLVSIRS